MSVGHSTKTYDLEERTYLFAHRVRQLVKRMPRTLGNFEDGKQLVRASGSVGANYIEANESLSDKDFLVRIKICRKEAKESRYWLRLIDLEAKAELEPERSALIQEAEELTKIFGAIVRKRSE
jgi:four helix bundle protein